MRGAPPPILGLFALFLGVFVTASACLTEVKLGDIPPDVGFRDAAADGGFDGGRRDGGLDDTGLLDADPSPSPDAGVEDSGFIGFEYAMSFYGPADVMCFDDLAGQESTYTSLTPAECGLIDGTVTLTKLSTHTWTLSGALILEDFGYSTIRLVEGLIPDAPPGAMVAQLTFMTSGPLGTTRQAEVVALDRTTATSTFADGIAGVELTRGFSSGSCFMTFGMRVDR